MLVKVPKSPRKPNVFPFTVYTKLKGTGLAPLNEPLIHHHIFLKGDIFVVDAQFLDLLAQKYDTEEKVVTEIINLEAISNLPKGTEHFVSDLHGEFQAFQHVLRNGSGTVKEKAKALFCGVWTDHEINDFASLV